MSADCPCGRPRAGCEYHDPALQPGYCESDEWGPPPEDCSAFDVPLGVRLIYGAVGLRVGERLSYTDRNGFHSGTVSAVNADGSVEVVLDAPAVRRVDVEVHVHT